MIQNEITFFHKLPLAIQYTWIWNDPEPLYFKWWCDLQFMACYKERTIRIGNKIVALKPGQLVASIDFLVKRWQKSKNMIIRFLKLLIEDKFINKETKQNVTIITILYSVNGGQDDCLKDNLEYVEDADKQWNNANQRQYIKDNQEDYLKDNPKDNLKDNLKDNPKDTNNRRKKEKMTEDSLPTPPTPAHARELLGDEKDGIDCNIPMTVNEGVEILKADKDWLLQIQRKFAIDQETIIRWLDSFCVECDCRGKQQHENLADIKQHFNDWMSKQINSKGVNKKTCKKELSAMTPEKIWLRCQAELGKSTNDEIAKQAFSCLKFENFDIKSSVLLIDVPNRKSYEYLEENWVKSMKDVLSKQFGQNIKLQYRILTQ